MEVKGPGEFQSSNFDEGYTQQDIPSTTQRYILRSSINNYGKVLNLASDPKEHFNIGLHIIQHQVISTGLLTALAIT